jgi:hypothetical protein
LLLQNLSRPTQNLHRTVPPGVLSFRFQFFQVAWLTDKPAIFLGP